MTVLRQVRLESLMARGSGSGNLVIALLDGPVAIGHPDLAGSRLQHLGAGSGACTRQGSAACAHGTFVAGILAARRGSGAPAICPGCAFLVRPIFGESTSHRIEMTASQADVAQAIIESVKAGARVLNLSAAVDGPSIGGGHGIVDALDYAMSNGCLVVAAAGNYASLGGSSITRHPGVIPVVSYDTSNRPIARSNLGASIGRRGLGAPGERVTSLRADGGLRTSGGTSSSAPFVTGTIALLWSAFPHKTATEIRFALTSGRRRSSVTPPPLDAWGSYTRLAIGTARE